MPRAVRSRRPLRGDPIPEALRRVPRLLERLAPPLPPMTPEEKSELSRLGSAKAKEARRCGMALPDGTTCQRYRMRGKLLCAAHAVLQSVEAGAVPLGLRKSYRGHMARPDQMVSVARPLALLHGRLDELCLELDRAGGASGRAGVWSEMRAVSQDIRRLAETEQQRLVRAAMLIPRAEFRAFQNLMLSLIEEHVHDEHAQDAIRRGVAEWLSARDGLGDDGLSSPS